MTWRCSPNCAPWAKEHAPRIAAEFYDHQIQFAPTLEFFKEQAAHRGVTLSALRTALEDAQSTYFTQIFDEAVAGGTFGVSYFERRLRVGRVHNVINLPLKWYVGSYATYFDLFRTHLLASFPKPKQWEYRARAERALMCVFNADIQAVVEAFYFDTFTAMGVRLESISVPAARYDLSDCSAELKALVKTPLEGISSTLVQLKQTSAHLTMTSGEVGNAVGEVADAISEVANSSEVQVRLITEARDVADDTAAAAIESRRNAEEGTEAAAEVTRTMEEIAESSVVVSKTIERLAAKSEQISGIVATINGIAGQTDMLALNAAIEAARAGEHGHGFAVVADQVRRLAENSQRAAGEIQGIIQEIQAETAAAVELVGREVQQTRAGTEVVERAREAFEAIAASVGAITGKITEIVSATDGIAAVAEQSSASAQEVSAATEQTAASANEVADAARGLDGAADSLEQILAAFDLAAV